MTRVALLLTLAILLWLVPRHAMAQAITLVNNNNMHFGNIEFDATHSGNVTLGTNGVANISGTGLAHGGQAVAGRVTIQSPSSGIVEVRCTNTATMRNGNKSVSVDRIQGSVNTGVAYDSANLCAGIQSNRSPIAVIDLALTPQPSLLFGGRATIGSNNLVAGTYITSGSSDFTIRVTVQ